MRVRGQEFNVAFVFDVWQRTPVFHRWGARGVTACGRTLWFADSRRTTHLRPDHAAKIGRPCERCFPPKGAA